MWQNEIIVSVFILNLKNTVSKVVRGSPTWVNVITVLKINANILDVITTALNSSLFLSHWPKGDSLPVCISGVTTEHGWRCSFQLGLLPLQSVRHLFLLPYEVRRGILSTLSVFCKLSDRPDQRIAAFLPLQVNTQTFTLLSKRSLS